MDHGRVGGGGVRGPGPRHRELSVTAHAGQEGEQQEEAVSHMTSLSTVEQPRSRDTGAAPSPRPRPAPSPTDALGAVPPTNGWPWGKIVLGVGVAAAIGIGLWIWWRGRKKPKRNQQPAPASAPAVALATVPVKVANRKRVKHTSKRATGKKAA